MGSTKLLLAGVVVAGGALASVSPAHGGAMLDMVKFSVRQPDLGRLANPFETPSSLGLGTEYFTVDTGGTVFFLGGILTENGTRFDLAGQLSLDELVLLSSAKPAILTVLGLGLLGVGLLNRQRAQRRDKPAS